jgi:short-subunit dehydrogenase
MDVKGKVAIVTGASSGIGLATARRLSLHGAKVALVARSKAKLEALAHELPGSAAFPADMSKESDIRSMISKVQNHFKRIDILVNNAGQGYDASVEKINIATFRKVCDLDLIGPIIAMQAAMPIMRKQGGGAIVNISSGTALAAFPNMAGYSSLKRALVGISLTAREELKKDNITVSVVYPFITLTDFEKNTIREQPSEEGPESNDIPKGDTAEYVANLILGCIKTGQAEALAHEWMKNMGERKG